MADASRFSGDYIAGVSEGVEAASATGVAALDRACEVRPDAVIPIAVFPSRCGRHRPCDVRTRPRPRQR